MRQFVSGLLILFFISNFIFGQTANKFNIEFASGVITPHYEEMMPLRQAMPLGFGLKYSFVSSSSDIFDKIYNSPEYGLGFEYLNLGNPKMLGEAFSLFFHWQTNFIKNDRNALKLLIAPGAAYISKIYHPDLNPYNIAIAKHANIYFKIALIYELYLNNTFSLNFSSGVTHFSNGAVKYPNKGLNIVSFSLGTSYQISSKLHDRIPKIFPQKGFDMWFIGTIGTTDIYSVGNNGADTSFLCNTISLGTGYKYNYYGKIGISLDGIINGADHHYWHFVYNRIEVTPDQRFIDYFRLGLCGGHEFIYKNFALLFYAGFYLYNNVKPYDWSYFRTGFRYYVKPLVLNITLKSAGFKAQYLEFGLGLYLNNYN